MKYRKKPIIVEAYQTDVELDIETLEGIMHASVGDYIITGVNGEKYPCKPDIFEKTYELVKENNYEIIEKALEENKRLKASYLENLLNEESKEYIYKQLKALEIIKKCCSLSEKYRQNSIVGVLCSSEISQEEYDLLKEVLL